MMPTITEMLKRLDERERGRSADIPVGLSRETTRHTEADRNVRAPLPQPVPRDQWPPWANVMSLAQSDGQADIGDTVVAVVGPPRSDAFKLWHAEQFGVWKQHCRCDLLPAQWNAQFPYTLGKG